mgnify:CR=1 FL=1
MGHPLPDVGRISDATACADPMHRPPAPRALNV